MAIRGMLLDNDGTLVLSNDGHARAWHQALAEHGYDVSYDKLRSLLGMGGDKVLPEIAPGLTDTEGVGKMITQRRKAIFLERYAADLQPAPGARALVERLQAEGLTTIIASSAQPDELEVLLQRAQVDDLLPERTSAQDAAQSKPAPDIVAVALERLGLPADAVLMVGDTPYDIAAAGKVGVGVIAFRCGGFSDDRLAGARAIYDDPADLLAHYETSPLCLTA
jgi:HAD superfamily hydrolase (TIGR01509 family)